jgi:hypothetical protein
MLGQSACRGHEEKHSSFQRQHSSRHHLDMRLFPLSIQADNRASAPQSRSKPPKQLSYRELMAEQNSFQSQEMDLRNHSRPILPKDPPYREHMERQVSFRDREVSAHNAGRYLSFKEPSCREDMGMMPFYRGCKPKQSTESTYSEIINTSQSYSELTPLRLRLGKEVSSLSTVYTTRVKVIVLILVQGISTKASHLFIEEKR